MKKLLFICLIVFCINTEIQAQDDAKTVFQTSHPWKPSLDTRADGAIVYGIGGNPSDNVKRIPFEERVQSWRDKGYIAQFMTGIAWGEYQDYFMGKWDGKKNHLREGQKTMNGDTIFHGHMVPYIVPTSDFIRYMKETQIKRAIDAGITTIYLEEPEFWMRAGYSDAFKEEWQKYYGFAWRAQHESPENTYLANKLKYHLYYNALEEVFTYAKEYGKNKGLDIKCYVPTHSLVNYTSWQIVSPEASLASLDCIDGYIAQVWTGTSREKTYYNGTEKERVFENAFLEYGSVQSMTAPTGRRTYFLTDPIEDRAKDWEDYKRNYQATFAAQLLYPMIDTYEVMPWPERIYEGLYRKSQNSDEKERIPRHYSTQMQIMINSLNDIKKSDNRVSGSHGIGVLMANSLMFQRFPNHKGYDDPQFSSFYGQTFPLLKKGIPVELVHIENTPYANTFKDLKILVVSYSNMKPLDAKYHDYIAEWVKNGGVLIYCGEDIDPYQSVMEWWNTNGSKYNTPSDHLFEKLGLTPNPTEGKYTYGKGFVHVLKEDPKHYVLRKDNDKRYVSTVEKAYKEEARMGSLKLKNNLYLERGAYIIATVMDESVSEDPLVLSGLYIDLFDKNLPILTKKTINPGEQAYLYNLKSIPDRKKAKVLCGASRIYDEKQDKSGYSFIAKSPINTTNVSRVFLPKRPISITVNAETIENGDWDQESKTYLLHFENNPEGVHIEFKW
ncbi:hypothetical protein JGH11_02200 [Dysgonomonas sp. Marseille-P4677]|uniref:hypothetical protein n=1 Tax=Dysgonomonas sp. Marseille-P4677 TaxID=2364790 RepID=UPI00191488A8|nr:hypothetical protein [Dysgonomonas sp. Marseille-P4677]MBK5719677.1 hypothetical protein [Dysgonomonas sp. Marseille-P4677]